MKKQDPWGVFQGTQGFGRLDIGSCAGFPSSRSLPPWTTVQYHNFSYLDTSILVDNTTRYCRQYCATYGSDFASPYFFFSIQTNLDGTHQFCRCPRRSSFRRAFVSTFISCCAAVLYNICTVTRLHLKGTIL